MAFPRAWTASAGARGDARAVMDVGATDGGTSAAASSSTARPADFLDRVDESGAPPASPPPDLLHTYASQLGIFSQESKRRRMGDVDDVGETAATESRAALPTGTSLALGVGAGGVAALDEDLGQSEAEHDRADHGDEEHGREEGAA